MLLKRQQSLKDINEGTLRELANVEEKFRQATSKSSTLSKTVKELTDEVNNCDIFIHMYLRN